jgi:glycosyltransferase involved in cell wall biosynthesis
VYLVKELVRRGHGVDVFGPDFPDAARVAAEVGIRVRPFRGWTMGRYVGWRNLKYLAYPWFLAGMVAREGRRVRYDGLLSQHAIAAVAAGRLRARLGVPVVMNFLDYLTGFMETWPWWAAPRRLIRALERFEVSLPRRYGVEGVMTVSDTLAEHFVATGYPRERVRAIYYGFDASRFEPQPSDGLSELAPPVVVMHGSFDQHHLGPIARTAMAQVHASRPEVIFRFVGRETRSLRDMVRRMGRECPGLRIECSGFVPYERVGEELRGATLGWVPYEESTGVHCAFVAKLVEYLAVGLPVASTALRSATGYFGNDPAVRFSPFEGLALARVILGWLNEPMGVRRELGLAAGRRVRLELDWAVLCRRAVDFVEGAIAGGTGQGFPG